MEAQASPEFSDYVHAIARRKARAKGEPEPADFKGSAHAVFAARR